MKDKFIIGSLITVGVLLLLGIIFRISCVTFIENYELGYKFDTRNGQTTIIDRTGYIVEPPFIVRVHTIDTRPVQVCINANARVLNCKLVRFKLKVKDAKGNWVFNKAGFDLFIAWHGRNDYSTESGASSSANLKDILMSYAYDGSKDLEANYPFLEVMKELRPEAEIKTENEITQTNDNSNKEEAKADSTTQKR
jgi:hypothetical protein